MLGTILLVFAFVLFVLAAFNVKSDKWNLIAAGLAFWVLSILLGAMTGHMSFH